MRKGLFVFNGTNLLIVLHQLKNNQLNHNLTSIKLFKNIKPHWNWQLNYECLQNFFFVCVCGWFDGHR